MNKKILALSALIATAAMVFVSCEADAGYGSAESEYVPTNSKVIDPSKVGNIPKVSSSSGTSGSSSSTSGSKIVNCEIDGECFSTDWGLTESRCLEDEGTVVSSCN